MNLNRQDDLSAEKCDVERRGEEPWLFILFQSTRLAVHINLQVKIGLNFTQIVLIGKLDEFKCQQRNMMVMAATSVFSELQVIKLS